MNWSTVILGEANCDHCFDLLWPSILWRHVDINRSSKMLPLAWKSHQISSQFRSRVLFSFFYFCLSFIDRYMCAFLSNWLPFIGGVSPVQSMKIVLVTSSFTSLSNPSRVQASWVNALNWWEVKLKLRLFVGSSSGAVKGGKEKRSNKQCARLGMHD